MSSCCQQQSRLYLILTNLLFFVCGCALLTFGMMATQLKFSGAILIPVNILKMITILSLILIFTSLIGILGGYYRDRKAIHILYATLVIIAFIYQIAIAVIVYEEAAHTPTWLSEVWKASSREYRLFAQKKFNCCGFTFFLDHPVPTSTCSPDQLVNSAQPCSSPMTIYVQKELSRIYVALFASLAIELLALCNVITHLCTYNTKKWEVSPEEQQKYIHHKEYNNSADTLVPPSSIVPSKARQF